MPSKTSSPALAATLRAAFVRRPHGVNGEVVAEPLGGDASRFTRRLRLRTEAGAEFTVRSCRSLGDGTVALAFEEITSRESAAQLGNTYLCVPRDQARRLPKGEWFVADLIGLTAVDTEGRELGTVSDIESTPAHDVVVVATPAHTRRFPMVKEFVRNVDMAGRTMVLAPWEEL